MIFVTVGTHEQQFNRLVKAVDELKEQGITEDIMIQTGYSTYIPKNCKYEKFLSYQQMNEYIEQADIIITHGGPATFMNVLLHGKSPIVVPRQKKFGEHVNDHQLEFVSQVKDKLNIVYITRVEELYKHLVLRVDNSRELKNQEKIEMNNKNFNYQLEKIINNLFEN